MSSDWAVLSAVRSPVAEVRDGPIRKHSHHCFRRSDAWDGLDAGSRSGLGPGFERGRPELEA